MKLNYWNCFFSDYDEYWDGESESRVYGCTHPDNEDCNCDIDNKWGGKKAECPLAKEKELLK